MPPKRAAAASKTKTLTSKPTTKRAAANEANKAIAKPPLKNLDAKAVATLRSKPGVKRKAEDDADDTNINGVKRQRSKSATPAAEKRKTTAKAPAAKKPRKKAILNHPPTTRLDVYVFGDGSNAELGLGTAKGCAEVKRPRLNPLLKADDIGVVHVSVGGMHTAVLTHDNKIYTWGVNDQGALGRDTTWEGGLRDIDDDKSDDSSDSDEDTGLNPKESTPGLVDVSGLPANIVWTQLACSDSATFALTDEGDVYGWGTFRSNEGIFGFNTKVLIQHRPTLIPDLKKITALAAGSNHILALDSKHCVFAWGSGQQNQLGRRILERTKMNSLVPTQFGLPKKMVGIGAGAYHSFAIHENGDVYSWGLNSFGETGIAKDIGDGGEADVHHPTIIESLRQFRGKVTHIEGGAHHTVAVTDANELLVWGRLDGSQLGLKISDLPDSNVIKDSANNPRILTVPTQVKGIDAVWAAAGTDHCVAVAKDGKGYAWGFSTTYQTGLGTDEDVEVATQIDNTATRGKKLIWSGCGGGFSLLAGEAGKEVVVNGVNGHA